MATLCAEQTVIVRRELARIRHEAPTTSTYAICQQLAELGVAIEVEDLECLQASWGLDVVAMFEGRLVGPAGAMTLEDVLKFREDETVKTVGICSWCVRMGDVKTFEGCVICRQFNGRQNLWCNDGRCVLADWRHAIYCGTLLGLLPQPDTSRWSQAACLQHAGVAAARLGPSCTCEWNDITETDVTDYYLGPAALEALDRPSVDGEDYYLRVSGLYLTEFRTAYSVALDARRFTEAERIASAAAVFDCIALSTIDDVPVQSCVSNVSKFYAAVRQQLWDELGVDPARAGAEAAERMAPERAEDVREALTYQYGRNLDCPPPDTPIELAKGYTLSKAKSKVLRNCWSSQRCTPDLALVMFNAARGDGTRVHYERCMQAGCFRAAKGFTPVRDVLSHPIVWGPWVSMSMTDARIELLDALLNSIYVHDPGQESRSIIEVVSECIWRWGGELGEPNWGSFEAEDLDAPVQTRLYWLLLHDRTIWQARSSESSYIAPKFRAASTPAIQTTSSPPKATTPQTPAAAKPSPKPAATSPQPQSKPVVQPILTSSTGAANSYAKGSSTLPRDPAAPVYTTVNEATVASVLRGGGGMITVGLHGDPSYAEVRAIAAERQAGNVDDPTSDAGALYAGIIEGLAQTGIVPNRTGSLRPHPNMGEPIVILTLGTVYPETSTAPSAAKPAARKPAPAKAQTDFVDPIVEQFRKATRLDRSRPAPSKPIVSKPAPVVAEPEPVARPPVTESAARLRSDIWTLLGKLDGAALHHATKLLDAADSQSSPKGKRKAGPTQAELLFDARARIKAIVASPDPQAFVANGCKEPPTVVAPSKNAVPVQGSLPTTALIDGADVKRLMARVSCTRKVAIAALVRHQGDLDRAVLDF